MFIIGPCALESLEIAELIADKLTYIRDKYKIDIVFKGSFDKANRTSASSGRGLGLEKSLDVFKEIKNNFGLKVTTDIHERFQAQELKNIIDVIQVPALLCRQTSLLESCFDNFPVVNVKKGQFLSPSEAVKLYEKCLHLGGADRSYITERGTIFGYNYLINDFKGLKLLLNKNIPVIFDATHSVQLPGKMGDISGGESEFVESQALCAASIGVKHFFFETHPNPEQSISDGPNMIHTDNLENTIAKVLKIQQTIQDF